MLNESIAVIGTGTMGRGIAETAAVQGFAVIAVEANLQQQERAIEAITTSVTRGIRRGKICAESPADVLAKIVWSESLESAAEADFVIEAASENEQVKTGIFLELDKITRPETILASNTSSISITRLGNATKRADRVVGMHFFNPVPIMEPVEVVRGLETSEETIAATCALGERLGKQVFAVADSPGFVVNRVLMPLINEAVFALHEGVADAQTIDSLTKLGCNHPMGPLQLADLVGLDVCLSILRVLHRELGDPKFRPCPLLVRMVDGGRLGRKSGHGFYTYKTP